MILKLLQQLCGCFGHSMAEFKYSERSYCVLTWECSRCGKGRRK